MKWVKVNFVGNTYIFVHILLQVSKSSLFGFFRNKIHRIWRIRNWKKITVFFCVEDQYATTEPVRQW